MPVRTSRRLHLITTAAAVLTIARASPSLCQALPGGARPPISDHADWKEKFAYYLLEGPQAQAIGAVGDRVERHVAAPPKGQELMLFRTEYARRFEEERETLRKGAKQISKEYDLITGIGQEVLHLSDGRIRIVEDWLTPPYFIRAAVATAPTYDEAISLLSYVAEWRRKGLYGGMPVLHSPSIAPTGGN